ncbi:MAG: hypothetical protein LBB08_02495, partial [Rickettsiales bacterium]|nr:hypothetical protein [Rickettsiales bacterium]
MKIICESSVSGKIWTGEEWAPGADIVDGILELRGLRSDEEKRLFLNPSMRGQMPDPYKLKDMGRAVEITAGAIRAKEKIAIFGDYDVDGITSTAILVKFFRELGADVIWHLPD